VDITDLNREKPAAILHLDLEKLSWEKSGEFKGCNGTTKRQRREDNLSSFKEATDQKRHSFPVGAGGKQVGQEGSSKVRGRMLVSIIQDKKGAGDAIKKKFVEKGGKVNDD